MKISYFLNQAPEKCVKMVVVEKKNGVIQILPGGSYYWFGTSGKLVVCYQFVFQFEQLGFVNFYIILCGIEPDDS